MTVTVMCSKCKFQTVCDSEITVASFPGYRRNNLATYASSIAKPNTSCIEMSESHCTHFISIAITQFVPGQALCTTYFSSNNFYFTSVVELTAKVVSMSREYCKLETLYHVH